MADKNEVHVGGIWFCKIGEHSPLQRGADSPMRDAVAAEYKKLTGQEPAFIFSGWSGELTEPERAVVENRLPVREATPPADAALADTFDISQIPEKERKTPTGWRCTEWKGFSARECKKCGKTKLAFRHETVGSSTDTHLYCVECGYHDYR